MKKFFNLILAILICLPALAQKSETRNHTDFTKISIGVPAQVRLTKGPFKVVLKGKDLDDIQSTVKGDQLVIKRKKENWSFFGNDADDLTIYISMPSLEAASLSGSGKLESLDQFTGKNIKLSVSGSGKMLLKVVAENLDAHVSGSGSIETSGSAQNFEAHISGSGKVKAEDLRAGSVDVHISGSGDCYVHVDDKLEARISGSGNVRYTGSPTTVNARTSGSGKISKRG